MIIVTTITKYIIIIIAHILFFYSLIFSSDSIWCCMYCALSLHYLLLLFVNYGTVLYH
jgi:hypothetical protein